MGTPEQKIIDQLTIMGYSSSTIISYLEARVAKEWEASTNFAECGPGEKPVFGVCRKVGGTPEVDPATGKPKKVKEEDTKSPQEKKLEAAAKAQGSSPDTNKKVVVDGKEYGWAISGGKPIMVPWGSIAGEKKVGPKTSAKTRKGGRKSQVSAAVKGRIEGLKKALEGQSNSAGKEAILAQIKELESRVSG
jgi:hypothetical protein